MNKKILIIGQRGCFGDLQLALYSIQAYAKKHPDHSIDFYWGKKEFIPLAYSNPHIDIFLQLPDAIVIHNNYDEVYDVGDNVCCRYEEATVPYVDKSRIEILCDVLDNCYEYVNPQIYLSPSELQFATELKNKLKNKFIVGVVSRTHSPVRNYDKFDQIYDYLPDDVHVLVFKKFNIDWSDTNWDLKNTDILIDKPIREVLSCLSICDVVVGCDTGLMHTAAGFEIPTIWLFGPTSPIAVREYENARVIQEPNLCAYGTQPCWYNLKCEVDNVDMQTNCLKGIDTKTIVDKVMFEYNVWKMINNYD